MGPSLDQTAAVLGPSPGYYNRTDSGTMPGYTKTNLPENSRLPHSEHLRLPPPPHHAKLPISLPESSRLADHVATDRVESLSAIRPTIQHEQHQTKSQETLDQRSPSSPASRVPFRDSSEKSYLEQGSRDQIPDVSRDLERPPRSAEPTLPAQRPPQLGGRPPNLPSHLFPNDMRPL